jgi:two-component system NtrC family sensor kinase
VDLFLQERVTNLNSVFRSYRDPASISDQNARDILSELRQKSSTFADVGLFDAEGILMSYAGPFTSLIGKDYSGEEWFQKLLDGERDFYISDVYLGFRRQPHFIIAVRHVALGSPWILRASVDPKKFGEFVGGSYLVKEAEAFIVNRYGQRQTLPATPADGQEPLQTLDRSTDTCVMDTVIGDETYLRAMAWLNQNDWALVVQVPKERAYAPIRQAQYVLLGIMVLALIFVVLIVLRNTRTLIVKLEAADARSEVLRRQLFNAAKLASVGEVAAGVAHEINNPLAIIYEEASMMKDLLDPAFQQEVDISDFRERLGEITTAVMRGRSITRKLLAFARRYESEPEPTDINQLLEAVIQSRESNIKLSNIEIVREFDPRLSKVLANHNELEQVALNLINNAKDAIEGAGTITVRTFPTKDGQIQIEFEDTGKGMTQEVMEKVFFPFFTTKGVGKGTGLGLSISYGIIKSLHGRIEVLSEVGRGTIITIQLPAFFESKETYANVDVQERGEQHV